MNLTIPKLVVFDMDGTMLDTEPLSMQGWQAAIKAQNLNVSQQLFDTTFNAIIGTNADNCRKVITASIPNFDYEAGYNVARDYMDDYMQANGVPLKPGLLELLDYLEKMNIKKCVATSTRKEKATRNLEWANIAHRFEVIVGGDEVEASKPNPDIFLKAASLCGIAPQACLVLEDSAAGTTGGYHAGMQVIIVPDILQPDDDIRKMAVTVCNDLFEVVALLGK